MNEEIQLSEQSLEVVPYINIKNATRSEIVSKANQVIQDAKDGVLDPLDMLIICNKWEKFCETVKEGIKKLAYDQATIGEKEEYSRFSAVITRETFGVKYNYGSTGDFEWLQADAKRKEREAFLKSIKPMSSFADETEREEYKKSITVVDEETGEEITLNPPIKTGTPGLKIQIK